ncbi:MAG: hypothetical protein AVDCRST_MAG19-1585 [uncultured Thermomicrobiales bacterium]|uniref:DUF4126 domain-containing protein n=1 Tax=uncultured Thermomicrobiales bacterium TaxID=1645740 RepID=A0A6J4U8Y1_9BACT|nr:MAG: hypothetical protein AVDCRST_MAG19-1585 [uncultured Thermomicrobiales bacterium]
MEYSLLTGLGLAAPAGLNAYLPLLVLALADRISTDVTLARPYGFLSSTWAIAVIVLLLTVELVVDKVPGLDHANDLVQSAVRPAAGAVLVMAATSEGAGINPVVSLVLGLLVAGAVHTAKAVVRPVVTLGTGGMGNPLLSLAEDMVAGLAAVVAVFLPVLSVGILLLFGAFVVWAIRKARRPKRAVSAGNVSGSLRR